MTENAEILRLEILKEIKGSFFSGKAISIDNLLAQKWQDKTLGDLGRMLQVLSEINYIFNNGNNFTHLLRVQNKTIKSFIAEGGKLSLKLEKAGHDYLASFENNRIAGDQITITGSNINFVNKSSHTNIHPNNEELVKSIPLLIDLIKKIKNDDTELILSALSSYEKGENVDPTILERATGFLANIVTIATPLIKAGAQS